MYSIITAHKHSELQLLATIALLATRKPRNDSDCKESLITIRRSAKQKRTPYYCHHHHRNYHYCHHHYRNYYYYHHHHRNYQQRCGCSFSYLRQKNQLKIKP